MVLTLDFYFSRLFLVDRPLWCKIDIVKTAICQAASAVSNRASKPDQNAGQVVWDFTTNTRGEGDMAVT